MADKTECKHCQYWDVADGYTPGLEKECTFPWLDWDAEDVLNCMCATDEQRQKALGALSEMENE